MFRNIKAAIKRHFIPCVAIGVAGIATMVLMVIFFHCFDTIDINVKIFISSVASLCSMAIVTGFIYSFGNGLNFLAYGALGLIPQAVKAWDLLCEIVGVK